MTKEDLLLISEQVLMEADQMAYQQWSAMKLANVQSICNFNIFWLRDVSPLICKPHVVDFFYNNVSRFKRKMDVKEFLMADLLVSVYEIDDFDQFRVMFTNYKKDPNMFKSLVKKSEEVEL